MLLVDPLVDFGMVAMVTGLLVVSLVAVTSVFTAVLSVATVTGVGV